MKTVVAAARQGADGREGLNGTAPRATCNSGPGRDGAARPYNRGRITGELGDNRAERPAGELRRRRPAEPDPGNAGEGRDRHLRRTETARRRRPPGPSRSSGD